MMPYQDCGPPRRILLLGSAERSVARSTEPQFFDFSVALAHFRLLLLWRYSFGGAHASFQTTAPYATDVPMTFSDRRAFMMLGFA